MKMSMAIPSTGFRDFTTLIRSLLSTIQEERMRYMVIQSNPDDVTAIRWLVVEGPDNEEAARQQVIAELKRETAPWHGEGDEFWAGGEVEGIWPASYVIDQLLGEANNVL